MLNVKELYTKLPGSWDELKLKDFVKVVDLEITDETEFEKQTWNGVDNIVKIIASLTDTSVDDLEDLPYVELAALSTKLAFLQELPRRAKKSLIQWKELDKVSYNDYVTFQSLQGKHLQNLPTIIKAFSSNEMTEAEILNLPTSEVVAGFFTLLKHARKSVKHTTRCSRVLLMKQMVNETWNNLTHFRKRTVK